MITVKVVAPTIAHSSLRVAFSSLGDVSAPPGPLALRSAPDEDRTR